MKNIRTAPLAAGVLATLFAVGAVADDERKPIQDDEDTTLTAEAYASHATDTAPTASSSAAHGTSDAHLVQMIASGGLTEVKLGELAKRHGQAAETKAFGQKMIDDHGKKNAELAALAERKGLEVPTAPLPEDQAVIDRLAALSGAEFDAAYKREMVDAHGKMERLLTDTSTEAEDADIRAYAEATLVPVRQHEQHAQALNEGAEGNDTVAKSDMEGDEAEEAE